MASIDFESTPNLDNETNNPEIEKDSDTFSPKIIPISRQEIQFPLIWKTMKDSKLFSSNEDKRMDKFRAIANT